MAGMGAGRLLGAVLLFHGRPLLRPTGPTDLAYFLGGSLCHPLSVITHTLLERLLDTLECSNGSESQVDPVSWRLPRFLEKLWESCERALRGTRGPNLAITDWLAAPSCSPGPVDRDVWSEDIMEDRQSLITVQAEIVTNDVKLREYSIPKTKGERPLRLRWGSSKTPALDL